MKNRGISSKIEDIKEFDYAESPHYSMLQVEKLREDLYQIVRMPFLKFSNKEYYTLTSLTYVLSVGVMFLVNAFMSVEDLTSMAKWHWEILNTFAGFVEPIITFVIPGVYFYRMSLQNELK